MSFNTLTGGSEGGVSKKKMHYTTQIDMKVAENHVVKAMRNRRNAERHNANKRGLMTRQRRN